MIYSWIPCPHPPTIGTVINAMHEGQCLRVLVIASKPGHVLVTTHRLTPIAL